MLDKWEVTCRGRNVGTYTMPSPDQVRQTAYEYLRRQPGYADLDISEVIVEPTIKNANTGR